MTKSVEELKSIIEEDFDFRINRQKKEIKTKMESLKEEMKAILDENDYFEFECKLTTLVRHIKSYDFTEDALNGDIRNKALIMKHINEYIEG